MTTIQFTTAEPEQYQSLRSGSTEILYNAFDMAQRFDISEGEAARIAEKANTFEKFVEIWQNEDSWTDYKIYKSLRGDPATTTRAKKIYDFFNMGELFDLTFEEALIIIIKAKTFDVFMFVVNNEKTWYKGSTLFDVIAKYEDCRGIYD